MNKLVFFCLACMTVACLATEDYDYFSLTNEEVRIAVREKRQSVPIPSQDFIADFFAHENRYAVNMNRLSDILSGIALSGHSAEELERFGLLCLTNATAAKSERLQFYLTGTAVKRGKGVDTIDSIVRILGLTTNQEAMSVIATYAFQVLQTPLTPRWFSCDRPGAFSFPLAWLDEPPLVHKQETLKFHRQEILQLLHSYIMHDDFQLALGENAESFKSNIIECARLTPEESKRLFTKDLPKIPLKRDTDWDMDVEVDVDGLE